MRYKTIAILLGWVAGSVLGCNGGGPTTPAPPTTTTSAPPSSSFQISVLITVYMDSESGALWSRGETTSERIGRVLLGVEDLNTVVGSTNLNNEGGRDALQAAVNRVRSDFQPADYQAAFDETQSNLERYLNDADNDGWSIDGRNGAGRDWPYDSNGNDPDGWTGQIVVTVTKLP